MDDVFLQCCLGNTAVPTMSAAPTTSAEPTVAPTVSAEPTISAAPVGDSAICEANPGCVAWNLTGICCPALGFGMLDCCNDKENAKSTLEYIKFIEGGDASGAAWSSPFLPMVATGFFLFVTMMLVH